MERIWGAGTARLLPRLLEGRTSGPVFLAIRRPRTPVATVDTDPTTGRAWLCYRRAAELFTTASGGWTLHQLGHYALTHLAEDGVDSALLKAKSRHASLRSLERYVNPSDAAVKALTDRHDPSAAAARPVMPPEEFRAAAAAAVVAGRMIYDDLATPWPSPAGHQGPRQSARQRLGRSCSQPHRHVSFFPNANAEHR